MKDTKEKIMNASIKLFKKKGYLETTTLEIANLAGVAEVTLFRKFNSKLTLFEESLRHHLSIQINKEKIERIIKLSSEDFYKYLLKNRLEVALKKKKLLQLIIKESFSDHLPKDLKFTEMVYSQIKEVLDMHMSYHKTQSNSQKNARIIAGLLLSIVIIPGSVKESIDDLINDYLKILI